MFVSFLLDLSNSKQGLTQRTHSLFMEIWLVVRGPENNFMFKIACRTAVGKHVMLKILGEKKKAICFHIQISLITF